MTTAHAVFYYTVHQVFNLRSPGGNTADLEKAHVRLSTFPSSGYFLHIINSFCCTFVELFAV